MDEPTNGYSTGRQESGCMVIDFDGVVICQKWD